MPTNTNDHSGNEQAEPTIEIDLAELADIQNRQRAAAATAERNALGSKTVEMLTSHISNMVRSALGSRLPATLDSPYGTLYYFGESEGSLLFAAEDGRSFTVMVRYNEYVGFVQWQKLAEIKAMALGHQPGEWLYAANLGYASICEYCGGMMAVAADRRPTGEMVLRACTNPTGVQQPLDFDAEV